MMIVQTSSLEIDPLTAVAVGANIVLVIVTVLQVYIYRREIKQRLRPWVGRNKDNLGTLKLTEKDIIVSIYNHGFLPAQCVEVVSYSKLQKPHVDIFKYEERKDTPTDMLPNEAFTYTIPLTPKKHQATKDGILYYGFKVTYTDPNNLNGVYELRGYWEDGLDHLDEIIVK